MESNSISKRIVYTNELGELIIIIPAPEYLSSHTIEDLVQHHNLSGITHYIIDESEIPKDRTFRGAWKWE